MHFGKIQIAHIGRMPLASPMCLTRGFRVFAKTGGDQLFMQRLRQRSGEQRRKQMIAITDRKIDLFSKLMRSGLRGN
jgi:hypothetical protein